jgi:competence protein ComEA
MTGHIVQKIAATTALLGAVVLSAGVVSTGQDSPRGGAPKAKAAAKALVDLNKATAEELQQLPGIGQATAKRIIAGRPYTKVEDLTTKGGVRGQIVDGIRDLVTVGAAPPPKSKKTGASPPPSGKVNINTADQATLESLPGVGPPTAKAIIAGRPYGSIDELNRVRGLGRRRLQALRELVTTGDTDSSAAATAAVAAKKGAPGRVRSPGKVMTKLAPGQRININTATLEELDALPGIGPFRAQAIVDHRKSEPFKVIEDIMKVKGIKEGEFGKIKDLITVK